MARAAAAAPVARAAARPVPPPVDAAPSGPVPPAVGASRPARVPGPAQPRPGAPAEPGHDGPPGGAAPGRPGPGATGQTGPIPDHGPTGPGAEPGESGPAASRFGVAAASSLRQAGSDLRRQLREQRRLRIAALGIVVLLLLGAVPLFLAIRSATSDPVFRSLDSLSVPGWAAVETTDGVSGSRWCFIECRFRERITRSERGPEETAQAYERALTEDGWRPWKVAYCPEQPVEGRYSCWRRDELTLDLWVRQPPCAADPERNRPSVAPSGAEGAPEPATEQECSGSVVSVKVRNAIDDERTRPQPSIDPSLTGEDPDPLLTDDPLADLSPSPS